MRVDGAHGYRLTSTEGHFTDVELPPLLPAADDVVVEVAGCGLCHTDIGYAYNSVPTRHPLPLILGHEIAGRVVDAGEAAAEWLGRSVVVPAVIPCGACEACQAGRPTICRKQFMPGNDGDGGFASHVTVRNLRHTDLPDVVRIDALASGRNRPAYFELMLMRALNFAGLQMSLVAELDGQTVGYLIVSLYYGEYGLTEPTASVDAIAVHPEFRRSRVAHALMQQFRSNAAAIGVGIVRTEVEWDDFDLLSFFKSEGFAPAKRICPEVKA